MTQTVKTLAVRGRVRGAGSRLTPRLVVRLFDAGQAGDPLAEVAVGARGAFAAEIDATCLDRSEGAPAIVAQAFVDGDMLVAEALGQAERDGIVRLDLQISGSADPNAAVEHRVTVLALEEPTETPLVGWTVIVRADVTGVLTPDAPLGPTQDGRVGSDVAAGASSGSSNGTTGSRPPAQEAGTAPDPMAEPPMGPEIGRFTTDEHGRFTFVYAVERANADASASPSSRPTRWVHVEALDTDGRERFNQLMLISADPVRPLIIRVPSRPADLPATPLTELPGELHPDLLALLDRRGIRTLADVRRAGSLSHVPNLPPDAEPSIRLLEAHADLSRVSSDVRVAARLIDAGYSSVDRIAEAPRTEMVRLLHEQLGDAAAASIHVAARARSRTLDALMISLRDAVFALPGPPAAGAVGPPAWPDLSPERQARYASHFRAACPCEDCGSAVSPSAYLADLLAYAVGHLTLQYYWTPITLQTLVEVFRQPFGDLPADCDAVGQRVLQVRICVETLRSYLLAVPPTTARAAALAAAERAYRRSAYEALLAALGTSSAEIRLAPRADRSARQELAGRLGLPIDPLGIDRPDALDALLFDPSAPAGSPQALTEAALEQLVGMVDTTRDPLSGGLTLDDPAGQIGRWRLAGVDWGWNTDANGRIHVTIETLSTATRVALFRDAARTPDTLVAEGQIAGTSGLVSLAARNGRDLTGTVRVAYTADSASVRLVALPFLAAQRLQRLRELWSAQDHPTDSYSEGTTAVELAAVPPGALPLPTLGGTLTYHAAAKALVLSGPMSPADKNALLGLDPDPAFQAAVRELYRRSRRRPLVDPDIIGPDDFRHPFAKAAPTDPDRAFDVWLRRRAWVDTRLQALQGLTKVVNGRTVPDLDAMLQTGYLPQTYDTTTFVPWQDAPLVTGLQSLWDTLTTGVDVESARRTIESDLHLSTAAFARLMSLRQQDAAATADPRETPLDEAGWREVRSIIVAAWKTALAATWRAEEQTLGVTFDDDTFWRSLREPRLGDWPPVVPLGTPLIDPEISTRDHLTEPTIGGPAAALWAARRDQLDALVDNLRTARETLGFEAMVRQALGHPTPGDPLQHNLDLLAQQVIDPDPTISAPARAAIENDLRLTDEGFTRLMELRLRDADPNPARRPRAAEWAEFFVTLATASKLKHLYPTWVAAEQSSTTGVAYWEARKAALPHWRASADDRRDWQEALRRRTAAPLVDPDLIGPSDLKEAAAGEPAYDVWLARRGWVDGRLTALEAARLAAPTPLDGFGTVVQNALGVPLSELAALRDTLLDGDDIRPRLSQLGLSADAFGALDAVRLLLSDGASVLDEEWADVYAILAAVEKRRRHAAWRAEEAAAGLIHGPDYFRTQPPPPTAQPAEPASLPRWLANARERAEWQTALDTRIEEHEAVLASVQSVAEDVEASTLASLRDALVRATDAPGADLATQAQWCTDRLAIDCLTATCQWTTRTAQAIETIQTVLLSVRAGRYRQLFRNQPPDLRLEAPDFDAEWTWLGTLSGWRSATLVHLHPANLLDPGLRRWQTPVFRTLVADVRSRGRLSPLDACRAADTYARYFHDICTLTIDASCWALSRIVRGEGCPANATPVRRPILYMLARGGLTGTVYWSTDDPSGLLGYTQSFWEAVPGLAGVRVANVFGVAPYVGPDGKRFVYVFLRLRAGGANRLGFTKYDPEDHAWDGAVTPLDVPPGWTSFDAFLARQSDETVPPRIGIRLPDGARHERELGREGATWSIVEWVEVNRWQPWREIEGVGAGPVLARNRDHLDMFWNAPDGSIWSAWWNAYADGGRWHPFRIGPTFSGATSPVAAVARRPDQMDLFVVGPGGAIYTTWWKAGVDHSRWHDWYAISPPGMATSGANVAAVARRPDRMDVFVVNPKGEVRWAYFSEAAGWQGWWRIGAATYTTYSTTVTAVTRSPGRVDVFMVDKSGYVRHNWSGPTAANTWRNSWDAVTPLKTDPTERVNAISRMPGVVDIFVAGPRNMAGYGIWTNTSDMSLAGGAWLAWRKTDPTPLAQMFDERQVAAVARYPSRLDLFTIDRHLPLDGGRGAAWTTWWDGAGGWGSWHMLDPDQFKPSPAHRLWAVSRFPDRMDVFAAVTNTWAMTTFWQGANWNEGAPQLPSHPVKPTVDPPYEIPMRMSASELQVRRAQVKQAFAKTASGPASNLVYLEEAFYFVPVLLALELQGERHYGDALDLWRTVYDYSVGRSDRKIYFGLEREESLPTTFSRAEDWLLDPLNPHAIAATRRNTYTCYTILSIARCLQAASDDDFTLDTADSIPRARLGYTTMLSLLEETELVECQGRCEGLTISLNAHRSDVPSIWAGVWVRLRDDLSLIQQAPILDRAMLEVERALAADAPWDQRFAEARRIVADARASQPASLSVGAAIDEGQRRRREVAADMLAEPAVDTAVTAAGANAVTGFRQGLAAAAGVGLAALDRQALPWLRDDDAVTPVRPDDAPASMVARLDGRVAIALEDADYRRQYPDAFGPPLADAVLDPLPGAKWRDIVGFIPIPYEPAPRPGPSFWFCAPANPVVRALRLHAELNLYKIRHCMNIAGVHREVEPYSAPTDSSSGLPSIGAGGQLLLPGVTVYRPTPHRYSVLIERARQLAQMAAQVEASLLAALEKRDLESYGQLKAQHDVGLARATVRLEDLRVMEAESGLELARLQRERAAIMEDHFRSLLAEGTSALEQSSLALLGASATMQLVAADLAASAAFKMGFSLSTIFSSGGQAEATAASAVSTLAASFGTSASIAANQASFERRAQDWALQFELAAHDGRIGLQQIQAAQDRIRVAAQGRLIASLTADFAGATADFLAKKFTNAALYGWMSGVLERVYAYFLSQATAMAELAAGQLAFERQETPPAIIRHDYWVDARQDATGVSDADRHGLTGSARLLQDIVQLDQYAFQTDRRKHQLTKVISLADLDPYAFQQFRETGVLRFATTAEMFDRDFPGHYLRLIRRVRLTAIALIPPTHGIRATLSTTGATRVVIGGDTFQRVVVRRDPQSVAFSSPSNSTGLFEVDLQPELRLPFEGLGVEGFWECQVPMAANQFSYSTFANLLVAFDYTSLDHPMYRQQVIQSLPSTLTANRAFSFRHELADAWYDLHNPDQSATPMTVRWTTGRDDFPPNLDNLRIRHLTLYIARADGEAFEVRISGLRFHEHDASAPIGGSATTVGGMVNTRNGNGAAWTPILGRSPMGVWELVLPDTRQMRERFGRGLIREMLFVVTYAGSTPPWPA